MHEDCIHNNPIDGRCAGVPECFLWATDSIENPVECTLHRASDKMVEATNSHRYRSADQKTRIEKLKAAGNEFLVCG